MNSPDHKVNSSPANGREATQKYVFAFWLAFLSALAAIPAYYRMFTGFSFYDDEGTMMVSVKQYLGGVTLYKQHSLPYGPVYFFYNWMVRTLSGTPLTHDAVRISSLIPWLLTALLCAWIVFRFSDSLALASVTHLLVYVTLSAFFHNEPGHPQELCILLLVCLAASAIVTTVPRWRLLGLISIGVLTAALLLVKVNIGTFAFLAASLALLAHAPRTKLSRLAFACVGAACLILPAVLMKSHLDDKAAQMYCLLVTVSMISVLVVLVRAPRTLYFSFRDIWIAFGSFSASALGVILKLKLQGVGFSALLHALVLDSLSTFVNQRSWYFALPVDSRWLPWILGGLVAAIFVSWRPSETEETERRLIYLKLGMASCVVVAMYFRAPLYSVVTPLCWLVLLGRPRGREDSSAFPRTLLCSLTVLQTLYAYPIAGSQLSFILVLPTVVFMILIGDLLVWKRERMPVILPLVARAAALLLLFIVPALYMKIALNERDAYDSLPALQLPGAGRIHLQDTQANDYSWLVQNLDAHCDVFIGLPEVPSLHIWTGKDPLEGMQADDWMLTASLEQENSAVAALAKHPNACAIYNPALVNFWNRDNRNLDSLPLVRYIHENFKSVGTTGKFSFLVKKERNLDIDSPRKQMTFELK